MVRFGTIEYGPSEKQRRYKEQLEQHTKVIADLCEAGEFEEAIKTSLRRPSYDGDVEHMGKELASRVKKIQPLLSHAFLNAQIFHSSIDCRQKTYLIHMLRKNRTIPLSLVNAILAVPGFNPNKADSYGTTPLMIAICIGRHDIVKILLAHPRIDVNKPTLFRRPSEMRLPTTPESPLMVASSCCDVEAVKLLLSHPAINVNWRNGAGQTALTIAYQKTINVYVSPKNYEGGEEGTEEQKVAWKTAFETKQAKAKAIKELLEARPEIHGPLRYRNTFHLNHADPSPTLVGNYGGVKYTHGYELFQAVKMRQNKRVAKLLAREDIDVNFDYTFEEDLRKQDETKYEDAKQKYEKGEISKEMLALFEPKRHPVHAYLHKPNFGRSPLTLAVETKNYGALKQLLAHPHIDVNRTDFGLYYAYFHENVAPVFDDANALLRAVLNNNVKAFNLLLEQKDIDINKVFPWSHTTVFMECLVRGHTKFAEALLARPELHLNVQDVEGDDALCLAARNGHMSIVDRLVDDPRQSQSRALKALRYAHDGQHVDICLRILGWLYPTPAMFHRAKKLAFLKHKMGLQSVYDLYDSYNTVKFAYKIDLHRNVVGALMTHLAYEKNIETHLTAFLDSWKLDKEKKAEIVSTFRSMKERNLRPNANEVFDTIDGISTSTAKFISCALCKNYSEIEKLLAEYVRVKRKKRDKVI